MSFSVYDNLLLVHCLPLRTTTVYDLLLSPTTTSERRTLPAFAPVHHARWQASGDGSLAGRGTEEETSASGGGAAEGAEGAAALGGEHSGGRPAAEDAAAAGPSPSDAPTAGCCPPASAQFVQPSHVVDLESATYFRCVGV